MQVLIVEPNKLYIQILEKMCLEHGIEPVMMKRGKEAIQFLASNTVELVFIARHMEDMDALEFCQQYRKKEIGVSVPIAMLTSDKEVLNLREILGAGITEVIDRADMNALESFLFELSHRNMKNTKLVGHILLVEDDEHTAALTGVFLEHYGLTYDHVTNVPAALQLFQEKQFDLILSDVVLEGKQTGLDLLREVRKTASSSVQIPFLAFSSLTDSARQLELLRSGANDFVPKPLEHEILIARVRNQLVTKYLLEKVDAQRASAQRLAMTDQLTNLPNRHGLGLMAEKYLSAAKRQNHPLSILVIDVDHFKKVNDQHGHAKGDEVLVGVGKWIQDHCRNEDFAARFGGEEFVVLLPHCDSTNAVQKAEKMRGALEKLCPGDIRVTASIGVAQLADEPDFKALFEHADAAVYVAKESGRNKVVLSKLDKNSEEPVLATASA